MASPQKEHGFTPIANELLRALIKQKMSSGKIRIWLALAIDSYGRSRKETTLSIGDISNMTGIARQNVSADLKEMHVSKTILVGGSLPGETSGKIMRRINKDYDTWGVSKTRLRLENETRPSLEIERGTNKVVVKKEKKLLRRKHERFIPPTPEEVTNYAASIGFSLSGKTFCDYYEARGWAFKRGQPMVSWKAAVRTWKSNSVPKDAVATQVVI